jgi:hypothetical protein
MMPAAGSLFDISHIDLESPTASVELRAAGQQIGLTVAAAFKEWCDTMVAPSIDFLRQVGEDPEGYARTVAQALRDTADGLDPPPNRAARRARR